MDIEKEDGPLTLEELQKMDFWLVRVPENLYYWDLPEEFKNDVKAIYTVYLTDKSVGHFLCSPQKKFLLYPVYQTFDLYNAAANDMNDVAEAFEDWIAGCDMVDIYMQPQDLEGLREHKITLDFPKYVDETEEYVRESLVDHYRGNPVW